ncbi:MAG: DUF2834 domain-containing protein [Mycobacteriaceae bacterium]
MTRSSPLPTWLRPSLLVLFFLSFFIQNSIALPYVHKNGKKSILDFFVGDIHKTTPGKFAMVDLGLTVTGFHTWAYADAKQRGIIRWWIISLILTFTVGIATAVPFYLYIRTGPQSGLPTVS